MALGMTRVTAAAVSSTVTRAPVGDAESFFFAASTEARLIWYSGGWASTEARLIWYSGGWASTEARLIWYSGGWAAMMGGSSRSGRLGGVVVSCSREGASRTRGGGEGPVEQITQQALTALAG